MGYRFFSLFFMQICLLCTSFTIPIAAAAQDYASSDYNLFNYSKDKKKLKKYVKELQNSIHKGEEQVFHALGKIIHFAESRFQCKFTCTSMFEFLENEGLYVPEEWRDAFKAKYRYYMKKKKAIEEFHACFLHSHLYDRETQEMFVSHWLESKGIHEPEENIPLSVVVGVSECMAGGFLMFCGTYGAFLGPWAVTLWSIGIAVSMDGFSRITGQVIEEQERNARD